MQSPPREALASLGGVGFSVVWDLVGDTVFVALIDN